MDRERKRKSILGMVVLGTILPLMGCETDTHAPQPFPEETFTGPLELRAHCIVWFSLEGGDLDLSEGLVLPNGACIDHFEKGDAIVGPLADQDVVVVGVRNPRTVPVTLVNILLETAPPVSPPQRELTELVEFRERYCECLEWLSNPPSAGGVPGSVLHTPKILQPGEKCFVELGRTKPVGTQGSMTTGSVVFLGPGGELGRLPISVRN